MGRVTCLCLVTRAGVGTRWRRLADRHGCWLTGWSHASRFSSAVKRSASAWRRRCQSCSRKMTIVQAMRSEPPENKLQLPRPPTSDERTKGNKWARCSIAVPAHRCKLDGTTAWARVLSDRRYVRRCVFSASRRPRRRRMIERAFLLVSLEIFSRGMPRGRR